MKINRPSSKLNVKKSDTNIGLLIKIKNQKQNHLEIKLKHLINLKYKIQHPSSELILRMIIKEVYNFYFMPFNFNYLINGPNKLM